MSNLWYRGDWFIEINQNVKGTTQIKSSRRSWLYFLFFVQYLTWKEPIKKASSQSTVSTVQQQQSFIRNRITIMESSNIPKFNLTTYWQSIWLLCYVSIWFKAGLTRHWSKNNQSCCGVEFYTLFFNMGAYLVYATKTIYWFIWTIFPSIVSKMSLVRTKAAKAFPYYFPTKKACSSCSKSLYALSLLCLC